MKKPELLAPAGNEKCVYAAVQGGADSIYLGLKNFGARSYADNFDTPTLCKIVQYCHLRGVKVYVTLNTLIADIEMNEALELARAAANSGADGVIVQDIGFMSLIRKYFSALPLHMSTQASVMNSAGVELSKDLGAVRCVVARELSFDEVKSITDKNITEIEIFVHGAQCYSYSGQCLMSSIYGGRSGNRGKCAGPCRLPYTLKSSDGKKVDSGYLLSPVDMCLGTEIGKVVESGANTLKIEGRMKGPEYVAATCKIYKDALEKMENISKEGMTSLENTFSRGGFSSGLFDGTSNRMKKDASNDDVYLNRDEDALKEFKDISRADANIRKRPVDIEFFAAAGEKPVLKLFFMGKEFTVFGEKPVEEAASAPLTEERIKVQLEKMGDHPFYVGNTKITLKGNIFMPVSEINSLRRRALKTLVDDILKPEREIYEKVTLKKLPKTYGKERFFTATVSDVSQVEALEKLEEIKEIYVPVSLYDKHSFSEKAVPVFPAAIREKDLEKYMKILETLKEKGVKKIVASDYGILYLGKKMGFDIIVGEGLSIFNSYSVAKLESLGAKGVLLSPEMTLKQISAMKVNIPVQVVAYGRLTLMKTANCPLKEMGVCGKNSRDYTLTDRKGEVIPIVCDCTDCTAYLLNSKPIWMGDKLEEIPENVSGINFIFTLETPEECIDIVKKYTLGEKKETDFTRGHFFRGVL